MHHVMYIGLVRLTLSIVSKPFFRISHHENTRVRSKGIVDLIKMYVVGIVKTGVSCSQVSSAFGGGTYFLSIRCYLKLTAFLSKERKER